MKVNHKNKEHACIKRAFQKILPLLVLLIFLCTNGCKKLVNIPEPTSSITTTEVFNTDATATNAIIGLYSDLANNPNSYSYARGGLSILGGLSADDIDAFNTGDLYNLQTNTLLATVTTPGNSIWIPAYFNIYEANAIIEGLTASKGVTTTTKNQIIGEAEFIRAFCHFYLVNFYGDVPLVTSTAFASNSLLARTPANQVYQQIIADLQDAQRLLNDAYLKSDNTAYPIASAERVRLNKSAATALLARVYLYTGDYTDAATQASAVINNSAYYSLVGNLNNVFLKNSLETIWQLQPGNTVTPFTTFEGNSFVPPVGTSPAYYLTTQLLGAFETGDQRKNAWTATYTTSGTTFYYPYKYKVFKGTAGSAPTEYEMVLRLAEQYLIRAEAWAQPQGTNLAGAIADLNTIRSRAGLTPLPNTLTQPQVLAAVQQERRIELFAEFGHRWLDLKRTGQATPVLGVISTKQPWSVNQLLYPIPLSEIQHDPNLTQNTGY